MKALVLKFRQPNPGEFGSYFIPDKVLYAKFYEVDKTLSWFLGMDDHNHIMAWSGGPMSSLTEGIAAPVTTYLIAENKNDSYIELDNTKIQLSHLYHLLPSISKFTLESLDLQNDTTKGEFIIFKDKISEADLAKEIKAFEKIGSGEELHSLLEFVASERYEITGFMCIRRLIKNICHRKLKSVDAYETWKDEYFESISPSGEATVQECLPEISDSEVISWAFGAGDKLKIPKYLLCSGILSEASLNKVNPYAEATITKDSEIFVSSLGTCPANPGISTIIKNLIIICGNTPKNRLTNDGMEDPLEKQVVFTLLIRNGREIDLCGNIDLSLITKIRTERNSHKNAKLFASADAAYAIETGSKIIEELRGKVSHNTPADIPGVLNNVKTDHLESIIDALEEKFDVVLLVPASEDCTFDTHADSISTEIQIDMGSMDIFRPIMITPSASGRAQETIVSLKSLDAILSMGIVNDNAFNYVSFTKEDKSELCKKTRSNLSKDEMLDAYSKKLAIVYGYIKDNLQNYVRFMTGMPGARIPFIVKDKKWVDGPSKGGYKCTRSLEEDRLIRVQTDSDSSYRYNHNRNIVLVAGRYTEYKWFTYALSKFNSLQELKERLHHSDEKLALLTCAMDDETKEKAIKTHTLRMLQDTVRTIEPNASEPVYGDAEEDLLGKYNMFSVLLGVYLFRASESDSYLDLDYPDDTEDSNHMSRVADNISSILDQSSFPLLTLLRTIYADGGQTT